MTAADSVPVVVGQARTGIRALAVGGRTYVPARGVFERLGARVSYTPPRLFVRRGDDAIAILHLDEPTAIVYGEPRRLDAPPFVRDRRVFVPLRLVSEILGARVSYASRPRVVRITPGAAPRRPRVAHLRLPAVAVPRPRPVAAAPTLHPALERPAAVSRAAVAAHPVVVPRPSAVVTTRPVRPVLPWWAFVPLALVLALAGALAAGLRRTRTPRAARSPEPAVRVRAGGVRVRSEAVREELVVEYASSVVRIPLRGDGDERNPA